GAGLRRGRETGGGSRPRSVGLHFSIAWFPRCHERRDQRSRRIGDLFNRRIERRLIRLRRRVESAELAHKLKGRRADFLFGRRGLEVEQRLYVSAHARSADWSWEPSSPIQNTEKFSRWNRCNGVASRDKRMRPRSKLQHQLR